MDIIIVIINLILDIVSGALSIVAQSMSPDSTMAQISDLSPIAEFINFIKLVAYIATIILVALVVWVKVKFVNLAKNKAAQQAPEIGPEQNSSAQSTSGGALTARWQEIINHIGSPREGEWKFAVIEADKLMDDTLKSAGYIGDTMGERLMGIEQGQIQTLDGLWDAHKTRNHLVHDANYFLRYSEAKRVIQLYEETLKELGAL